MKNQKVLIILLSFVFCWSNTNAQIVPELYRLDDIGGSSFEFGDEVVLDSADNLYVLGNFGSTVDFDHGPGVTSLTANGFLNVFIAKYDKHGDFQWVKQIEYAGVMNPKALVMDSAGALIVLGSFSGTADFDPAGAGYSVSPIGGNEDIFVMKLSLDGDFIWVKTFGSNTSDQAADAIVDQNENIYVSGAFSDTIDFNPSGTPMILIPDASYHNYLLKLDASGNTEWVRSNVGTATNSFGWDLSCDESNNIYFVGEFHDSISFGPGFGTLIGTTSLSTFIEKIDPNGATVWVKRMLGTNFNDPKGIIYNPLDHFLYLSGRFDGPMDFNPDGGGATLTSSGGVDVYITKWDTSGNFVWVKSIGNENHENINEVSFTSSNEILVCGTFEDTLDLDPGPGVSEVISNGDDDIFLLKLDANGAFIGGFSQGGQGKETARVFMTDSDDAYYCFGYYADTVDFDPSGDSALLVSQGPYNIFVQKFYSCSFIDSVENTANVLSVQTDANTYQWINCSDSLPIAGATSATFSPASSGSYACIIDLGGCFDTTACAIITTAGIQEFSESAFTVYPVPFGESLTIQTNNWETASVSLLDARGRRVSDWVKMTSSSFKWQLPNLDNGIYFVEIREDESKELKRIKVIH